MSLRSVRGALLPRGVRVPARTIVAFVAWGPLCLLGAALVRLPPRLIRCLAELSCTGSLVSSGSLRGPVARLGGGRVQADILFAFPPRLMLPPTVVPDGALRAGLVAPQGARGGGSPPWRVRAHPAARVPAWAFSGSAPASRNKR